MPVAHPRRELEAWASRALRHPVQGGSPARGGGPRVRTLSFPRPVGAAREDAVAAPSSRAEARRSHGHGCRRRSQAEARAREGAAAPREARARGVRRCRLGPGSAALARQGWRPVPARARPAVFSFTCTHRAPPAAHATARAVGSRVCHLQDPKPPTPSLPTGRDFRIGPCFSSGTITTPPPPSDLSRGATTSEVARRFPLLVLSW